MRINLKKHAIKISLGLMSGLIIYFFLAYSEYFPEEGWQSLAFVLAALAGVGVVYLVQGISRLLNSLFPWDTQTGSRLASGIILNTLSPFAVVYLLSWIVMGLMYPGLALWQQYQGIFIKLAIVLTLLMFLYSVIYFALYSYHQYAKVQVANIQQEREQINLQLSALKSQLSPHFLFNSFNTISSLLDTDTQKAESFIRKLGQCYQYTLSNYNKSWIPLSEEIEFVQSYHYLLKTRFADHLQCRVNISAEAGEQTKVPPLAIQLLVENAVKHNKMEADNPLFIDIHMDDKWIWVSNNKTESPAQVDSFKIGLQNVRTRYSVLAKKQIEVINDDRFTVKLPIL